MTTIRVVWAICGLVLTAAISTASGEEPKIQVSELAEGLYLLSTDQSSYTTNTIASVGDDGVLLVDTQAETDAEALKQVVDGFGRGAPKIIINTHRHVEHVGGNAIFGEEPIVIAHDLVPTKLRSGSYLFNEFPSATYPDITFADRIPLWFNGEEIRLTAFPGSHDDNEIIVHFTDSKVVHLSSLVNGFNFPSVDSDGDALTFAPLVEKAIEILPEDVTIVSGHNRTGTVEDLRAYHEMLMESEKTVRKGLADGKDIETLKSEKSLERWNAYAESYVSVDQWTETLAEAITPGEKAKPTLMEPLYHEWKENGADAAIDLYFDLKKNRADDYDFRDLDLLIVGDKLLAKKYTKAAIVFLERSLIEFPEDEYAYYANYDLALAYRDLGKRETAIEHCRKASEARPESQAIASLLNALESGNDK
jgi:glyoxylase-like metal-dependent hydrolase (beta-lactamase superfamily II)